MESCFGSDERDRDDDARRRRSRPRAGAPAPRARARRSPPFSRRRSPSSRRATRGREVRASASERATTYEGTFSDRRGGNT
eukprot:31029-Pelagococcus_subviridis.AAC.7